MKRERDSKRMKKRSTNRMTV
uniref:Uncharacterized protein n=1 Tax=Anopheles dirus TaxID=7168 RepID=A0A182NWJ9_9DIPT